MEIPQRRHPRLVVGVGASAGGLKALESFFAAIHVNSGCCYIVVQHLSPGFKSLMDELLGRRTQIPIKLAEASLEPEADTIYLVPSHMQVTLRDRCLQLHPRPTGPGVEMPINLLFHSLGREYGPAAVGVVLSGTGSDGTEGVRAIHANGGLVIVQTPASAEFDGMPRSALALGVADYTLPPEAMAQVIGAYAENPSSRLPEPPPETTTPVLQSEYAAIFAHIQQSCGIDFAPYKIATIDRRVRRRMDMLECADLGAYTQILFNQAQETDLLYHDLLIGVTEFFRDPAAFEALRENVLRPLVANASRDEIRIWSAACASGEEPYTLAILMEELTEEYQFRGRWSIFATDVHRATLARAGQGLYDAVQLSRIPAERRDRYFTQEESGKWRVLPRLRQRIVFAHHNLLADPPFTKLDLVTCRNLLIYFGPQAQERALGIFHYALRTDGCLLLGISEGLGKLENDFEVIDGNQKLFRKTSATRLPLQLGASVPSPRLPRVT
ncbi:MAG: hypothetical protein MUE42_15735, partial [Opitutaceae bacterium]|nr:hypothetical protein [Opitutaceae bacterium]